MNLWAKKSDCGVLSVVGLNHFRISSQLKVERVRPVTVTSSTNIELQNVSRKVLPVLSLAYVYFDDVIPDFDNFRPFNVCKVLLFKAAVMLLLLELTS